MKTLEVVRQLLEPIPEIRLAYVFGSMARGEARLQSDLDLAWLTEPPLTLGQESLVVDRLERATGREVQVIDLWRAPPLLLAEIVREGVPVVCRDETEQALFEGRAIARYLDTDHLRRVQHVYLRERALHYGAQA